MNAVQSQAGALPLYWKALIRLIYPARCALCSKSLNLREEKVCSGCKDSFHEIAPPVCMLCSREIPRATGSRICSECRQGRHYVDKAWSLYAYNDPMKKLLHLVKFSRRDAILKVFEPEIKRFAAAHLDFGFDVIVPVPVDWRKKWERGFNQAEILAGYVKRTIHCPVSRSLRKKKMTPAQSLLSKRDRMKNLQGTFLTRGNRLSKKHVLLIDDIYTTGATVNECARVLKESGAKSVSVFTLARAGSEWN